ncbi:S-adenosylmethionine uptake transporter [Rickettsia parkeri str. Tate's Hell]|uniref:S-adenosylmethionine uptake transporter n=1 Tax=Rickettsia parkeri str. Tate's Hell TaxID=1359189 RepID=A0ABR5DQR8_RICPA|nr:DMT family transporter [Rickettsia parkeri]AFC74309.1 S-adenosylmethionine transporter [Rickettsia parkeri str. Portsmouth]KJV94222.1 S-adenosylmethionine uptake transporter [Rickettsia parkeri str. Grand Bay]KJV96066.1 S-adenosylmethionine uptake transporter [Rickettsia parkeri str. AT\
MNDALKTYLTGIGWFLLSLVSSSANDVISKYLGTRLHSFEVAFFRFFFSSIVLLPFVVYYGKNTLKTSRPFVHILRGLLLFFGMTSWTYGLTIAPVTTATVVSFSIPLFTLILAVFFLNENIIWPRWVVTVVGFIGLVVTLKPHAEDFNPEILYFVLAAISFAMLDIINKKFVIKESMISMLFYSAIVTAIVSLPVASQYWLTPSSFELALLFVLGSSGSLILFFLLKAFSMVDATATAPYRYLELVISVIAAYFIFNEFPDKSTLHGAVIIIPTTLFIIYSEKKTMNRKHESQ